MELLYHFEFMGALPLSWIHCPHGFLTYGEHVQQGWWFYMKKGNQIQEELGSTSTCNPNSTHRVTGAPPLTSKAGRKDQRGQFIDIKELLTTSGGCRARQPANCTRFSASLLQEVTSLITYMFLGLYILYGMEIRPANHTHALSSGQGSSNVWYQ